MNMKEYQTFFSWDKFKSEIIFFIKKYLSISSKFLSFMTTKNPDNGNETKPDIFFMGHIQI